MTNDKQMLIHHKQNKKIEDLALMINQYGPALMAFVSRIVTVQEDAEDVVALSFGLSRSIASFATTKTAVGYTYRGE